MSTAQPAMSSRRPPSGRSVRALPRRRASYLATVLLDLAAVLELPDLYRDAFNDLAAVDIATPALEPLDEPGQYLFDRSGLAFEANVDFDEDHDFSSSWRGGGAPSARAGVVCASARRSRLGAAGRIDGAARSASPAGHAGAGRPAGSRPRATTVAPVGTPEVADPPAVIRYRAFEGRTLAGRFEHGATRLCPRRRRSRRSATAAA